MPENAIRSVNDLGKFFGKDAVRAAAADESVLKKSQEIIAALNLTDEKAANLATTASITTAVPCATGTTRIPTPSSPK